MNRPLPSDVTTGDPGLLNGIAWSIRWQDRQRSVLYARTASERSASDKAERGRINRGRATLTLSWQAMWSGHFDDSLRLALEAERTLSEDGFPDERAHAYAVLGTLHYSRGRLDLAVNSIERGLSLADERRDAAAYVHLLVARSAILRLNGDSGRAGLVLGRAEETALRENGAFVQLAIARWLFEDGETEKALERAERSVLQAAEYRCRVIEPYARRVLGECLTRLGLFEAAASCLNEAMDIAREDEDLRAQTQCLFACGQLDRARGNVDQALKYSREGARLSAKHGYNLWREQFARQAAEMYEARGDLKAALNEHNEAWRLFDKRRS